MPPPAKLSGIRVRCLTPKPMHPASRPLTQILLSKSAPSASLTLTCHTDLGASHYTHSTTSQPHDPQSCSNLHGWQHHARPLTLRTQTEKPDSTHGFQGGSQNGPTPPPPPSARGQISNGHISATLALFPTRVTTAPMAQRCRTNGVVLFWGKISANGNLPRPSILGVTAFSTGVEI